MRTRFEKLLEPFHIGRVQTRNRMIKAASGVGLDDERGYTTEEQKAEYEAIARGGVGLIIVESHGVDYPLGTHIPNQLHIENDTYIPGLKELAKVIHKHSCPTFLQLMHGGPLHNTRDTGLQPVSSSALTESEFPEGTIGMIMQACPRELSIDEIGEIEEKFIRAAGRVQEAGFDGVEVNAATCHLLNSFLSRAWNKRQDAYGCGNLESRSRIVVEIIKGIKKRLGQDFPVGVLINGAEYGTDKGTTIEESQGFARILQDAGADAIQIRADGRGPYTLVHVPDLAFYPEPPEPLGKGLDGSRKGAGLMVPLAAEIKKVVSIPVIAVGRLDPELGEKILRQGKADFISFARRLLADPELPNKVASGRLEDIAPCTACNTCFSYVGMNRPARCRVNAALGREQEGPIKPAEKKKRVVVVGGGPAGMEAARVAALRGHEVTLYERESKLGGLLPLAALVKGVELEDLPALVRYLKTQITKLGVKINLGKEFNPSVIDGIQPDVLIIAAGGIPTVPEIPGINRHHVVSNADLHRKVKGYLRFFGPKFLRWLTKFWMPLGGRVVIIGGAMQGCELAEFLTKRGRKVTIVETADELGDGLLEVLKPPLFSWLAKKGVTMMTGVKYEEITEKGLTVITKEGKRQTVEADTIVTALPLTPNTELFRSLEGKVPEIYFIGDCRQPQLIVDAVADGWRIGRNT